MRGFSRGAYSHRIQDAIGPIGCNYGDLEMRVGGGWWGLGGVVRGTDSHNHTSDSVRLPTDWWHLTGDILKRGGGIVPFFWAKYF